MSRFIYVDNSNLFIEARKLAAVQKGMVGSMREAQVVRAMDNTYFIDYFHLRNLLSQGGGVGRAVLFGSKVTGDDEIWKHADTAGCEVRLFERNLKNKEKKIDTAVVTEMLIDAFKFVDRQNDQIVLVAGASDYLLAVVRLREDG